MEQNRVCSTEICLINMQDQLLSEGLHHRILQLILRAQRRYIAGKHSYGETQKANLEMPVASWRGSELHSSITTFVLLFKNEKKKKKRVLFFPGIGYSLPMGFCGNRIISHAFKACLWHIHHSRVGYWGWWKRPWGDKADRIEADYFPLTFNSLFYSKYCWQDFWTFGNSVWKPDNE